MPFSLLFFTFYKALTSFRGLAGLGLLCLLCCSSKTVGQQPSYQVVGEDFLEGKDIYSLMEGQDKKLWIGTDEGLLVYDGKNFKSYDNPNLRNSSVFSLCDNSKGEIFYVNFSGQIMKVVEDSLEVYYELPDSLLGMGIDIEIDDQDEVVIFCKYLMKIDAHGQLQKLYHFDNYNFSGLISKWEDGRIALVLGFEDIILTLQKGEISLTPFWVDQEEAELFGHPELHYNGEEVIIMHRNVEFYLEKKGQYWHKTYLPERMEYPLSRAFTKGRNIWVGERNGGSYRYHLDALQQDSILLFPQYQVSYHLDDSEGNLWLGTFKDGLLRIPHLEVEDYRNNSFIQKHPPVAITAGPDNSFYVIDNKGVIYQVAENNSITILSEKASSSSEYLQYIPWANRLYLRRAYYDLSTATLQPIKTAAVRSLQGIPPNNLFFVDYRGAYFYSTNTQEPTLEKELQIYYPLNDEETKERDYKVVSFGRPTYGHYQAFGKRFWLGTTKNLLLLEQGDSSHISYNNEPVIATAIASWEDSTYIATANGILHFVGNQCQGYLSAQNVPLIQMITQMEQKDGYLYLAGVGGFQKLNLITEQVQGLDISDGLLSNKVLQFALLEEEVVLLTSKGLQKVKHEVLQKEPIQLQASVEALYINGKPIDTNRQGVFHYFENELEVHLRVPYWRDKSNLSYVYRMRGLDKNWKTIPVYQDRIIYNALPAGQYTFEVQIKDKKHLEGLVTSFTFTITPPFWETWWFISLCVLGLVLLVSLFFLIRINILNKQNQLLVDKQAIEKQLVESQQTALRSQMNPHFMFNALNSIQEMIVVNEKKAASIYLGKFADLMRLYLNHSREKSITLAEELEALQLYLELEQIRFEDHLTITIKVAPDILPEELTLPPMLIQPYVENAFKHGLLHQPKNRQLNIEFSLEEEKVCCLIQDNGVGRARSAQIKQAQNIHYDSFASSATQKRLNLLNYNQQKHITATIKDLVDEQGKGIGTAVYICIPLDWEE